MNDEDKPIVLTYCSILFWSRDQNLCKTKLVHRSVAQKKHGVGREHMYAAVNLRYISIKNARKKLLFTTVFCF